MSVVAEKVIQEILINTLEEVKRSDTLLDYLFRDLKASDLQELKDAFKNTTISVLIGFPRKEISLPMISILLGSENESQPYIGNFLGQFNKPYDVRGTNLPEEDTPGSFVDSDFWYGNQKLDTGKDAYGTSAPRKLFKVDVDNVTRLGSTFSCNFVIHIVSLDGFYTAALYQIVKFIIESNILTLEGNGIFQIYLSGTDLSPLETGIPDPVFDRTLSIACLNTIDWTFSTRDKLKFGIYQTECHMDVNPKHPCDISGTIPPMEIGIGRPDEVCTTIPLKEYPLQVTSVTPPVIMHNTTSYLYIGGNNIDKNIAVEFINLPYNESVTGIKSGIKELDRDYVYHSNEQKIRFKIIGYSRGTTDIRFTNPDGESVVIEGALNVI